MNHSVPGVPGRRHARKFALALGATVVTLAALEVVSRLIGGVSYLEPPSAVPDNEWRFLLHQPSSVPGLPYEMAPNRRVRHGSWIETNSHGMRDAEVTLEKPAGVRRIAVLGDSYAFGWGLPVEEAFPDVLERLFATEPAGPRVEVLNFGVSGYTTTDEAAALRGRALAFDPDIVLVAYVLNDPETEPIEALRSHFQHVRLWQYSHLARRIAKARRDWDIRRLGQGSLFVYLHAHPQKWPAVVDAFEDMAEASRSAQAQIVLAIFPIIPRQTWRDYRYGAIHRQVADAARAAGMDVIDLLDTFSRVPPEHLYLSTTDPHPNALGHRLAAETIYRHLRATARLRGPSSGTPAGGE